MKVYELINKLSQMPAGAKVVACMGPTLNADVIYCEIGDPDEVIITAEGDAEIISDEGEELGTLIEFAKRGVEVGAKTE